MTRFFTISSLILLTISSVCYGQISGPSEVLAGSTQTYSCTNCPLMFGDFGGRQHWAVTNGTILTNIYDYSSVTVQWSSTPGTGTIAWRNISMIFTQNTITLGAPPSTPPSPTFVYECTQGRLMFNGSPPSGVTWYWQTTSGGMNMGNSASEWVVTSPDTYFLRAKNNYGWSTAASVYYPGTDPEIPPPAVTTGDERCTTGQVTLSSNGLADRWYTVQTGGIPFHTGVEYTGSVSATTTYYVEAATAFNCINSTRTPVTATVYPESVGGSLGSGTTVFGAASGTINLSGHTGTVLKWQKKVGELTWEDITHSNASYGYNLVSESTAFRAVVKSGVCEAQYSGEFHVEVHPLPVVQASSSHVILGDSVTLDAGAGFDSYVWKNGGGSQVGYARYYETNVAGVYTVTVTKTGVSGTGISSPFRLYAQLNGQPVNHIVTNAPQRPVRDVDSLAYLAVEELSQNIQYFDGLGRLIQTVVTQGSPDKKDVVQPMAYDSYGREVRKYLPVTGESSGHFKNGIIDPITGNYTGWASEFYNGASIGVAADPKPFAESVFEKSPLHRVLKQGAPGEAWQPDSNPSTDHSVKYSYVLNILADSVLDWRYNELLKQPENGNGSVRSYYAAGKLHKTITTDEHNNEIISFTNIDGNLVLKRVQYGPGQYTSTYYLHDEVGNLMCVITPEGVHRLGTEYFNSGSNREAFLKAWAYRYQYDYKNRLVEKQIPGAEPHYITYDKRDRVILTQDGNQRLKKQWSFIKYDQFNRPVVTGIFTPADSISRDSMQVIVNNQLHYHSQRFEQFDAGQPFGYTNQAFPTTGTQVHTATYYDSYAFLGISQAGLGFMSDHLTGQDAQMEYIKGKVTGSAVNILGTDDYLWSATYYDRKSRVLQTVAQHHKDSIDRTTNRYDFVRLMESKTTHHTAGNSYVIKRKLSYDHAGRLIKTIHAINDEPEVITAAHQYNELGQLVTKLQHSRNNGSTYAQSNTFAYNIRGWLTSVNDINQGTALFNFRLNYNDPTVNGGTAQYNGNVSETIWRTSGQGKQGYGYYYDPINRLKEARFYNLDHSDYSGRFTEKIGTETQPGYDLNGNIKRLQRHGKTGEGEYGLMDDLTYTYAGNQLKSVNDAIALLPHEDGYRETSPAGTDEYDYNANGAMTRDDNKGIVMIRYNQLNLPEMVKKSGADSVVYTYAATGRKLKQVRYGSQSKVIEYAGEFYYENDTLRFIQHEEGRLVPDTTATAPSPWEYQYHLKDHLGSIRVTFSEKTSTTEYKATLEDNTQATEQNDFSHYSRSGINVPVAYNHTPGGNYSQLLHGGHNSQVGLAKSFEVNSGDVFDLEVYAKFQNLSATASNYTALFSALVNAFSLSSTGGTGIEGQQAHSTFESMFSAGPFIEANFNDDEEAPKAYLNYILFDENFVLQDFGFDQVDASANQSAVHDYLALHVRVQKKGYLYIYLSNENTTQVDVFFDDLRIVHHTGIQQSNDYYAFGMAIGSLAYQKPEATANTFLFTGKEAQPDVDNTWYDFGARMYMSDIGRWGVLDPLAEQMRRHSPYNYAFNNPVRFIDPDGMRPSTSINPNGSGGQEDDDDERRESERRQASIAFTKAKMKSYRNGGDGGMSWDEFTSTMNDSQPSTEELTAGDENGVQEEREVEQAQGSIPGLPPGSAYFGQLRHLLGPDAIGIAGNVDLVFPPLGGVDVSPMGAIFILRGPDRGKVVPIFDIAYAQGADISASIKLTNFYFNGDLSDMNSRSFLGWRLEANVAFTAGVDFGYSIGMAPNLSSENFLGVFRNAMFSESFSIGGGIPAPFVITGNINAGYTFDWRDIGDAYKKMVNSIRGN